MPKKDNPLTGQCYVLAELLYHALGGKEAGWTPQVLRVGDGLRHWYLKHESGVILDPTANQFSEPLDYQYGRGIGFLTKRPSKRTLALVDKILSAASKETEVQ